MFISVTICPLHQCHEALAVIFTLFKLVDRAPLLLQAQPNEEKGSHDGSEEEAWEKALSVERFGDIIAKPVAANVEKMGRSYGERDFECEFFPPWKVLPCIA